MRKLEFVGKQGNIFSPFLASIFFLQACFIFLTLQNCSLTQSSWQSTYPKFINLISNSKYGVAQEETDWFNLGCIWANHIDWGGSSSTNMATGSPLLWTRVSIKGITISLAIVCIITYFKDERNTSLSRVSNPSKVTIKA